MSKPRKQQRARSSRRPGTAPRGSGRRRWLLLPLGLGIAALGVYVAVQSSTRGPASVGPPPLDHIDDASRVRLERVLRDAELQGER